MSKRTDRFFVVYNDYDEPMGVFDDTAQLAKYMGRTRQWASNLGARIGADSGKRSWVKVADRTFTISVFQKSPENFTYDFAVLDGGNEVMAGESLALSDIFKILLGAETSGTGFSEVSIIREGRKDDEDDT